MKRGWLKNTALATILSTTLTACGGGGSGGGGAIITNTAKTIKGISFSLASKTVNSSDAEGASDTSSIFTNNINNLAQLSASVEIEDADRQDASELLSFFDQWENFNNDLSTMKSTTTGRKDFDRYMNYVFPDTPENRESGIAGKSWRQLHYEIHGAYLLLVKHKSLVQAVANNDSILDTSKMYLDYVNDDEINAYENLTEDQMETRLANKGKTDSNIRNYNDDALVTNSIVELDSIESVVLTAFNNINSINSRLSATISKNFIDSISPSGLNYHDIDKSKNILVKVDLAISTFERILYDLNTDILTDDQKLEYYQDPEFQEAYKSYLYIKEDVKPILDKVKNANNEAVFLSESELETLGNDGKDNKTTKMSSFINEKIALYQVPEENPTDTEDVVENNDDVAEDTTEIDNSLVDGTESETPSDEVTVSETVDLSPLVDLDTESTTYIETTYTDGEEFTETSEGSSTTNTVNRDVTNSTNNGTNIWTFTTIRYVDTVVTTPITTTVLKTRTYTDKTFRKSRQVITTTTRQKITYSDGTTSIVEGTPEITYGDWAPASQINQSTRSENIIVSTEETNRVSTSTDAGNIIKTWTSSSDYTDSDINLGTKTTGLSEDPDDFKTAEFNKDSSKSMINADKAYARGWTGKGSVLGVIDSYQQTDHEALDGKYKWYNDYVRYEDGTTDENGNELGTVANGGKNISHGTHVAGIVAGKRDGTQFHGVAFDADLVGANVDYYGRGGIHTSYAQHALQDIAKLKTSKDNGGEGMNIVAVNMSFNKTNPAFHYGDVATLSDGTYSASKIVTKMLDGKGDAQYWKVGTDNDIILVNSAGNGLYMDGQMNYDFSLDPGIWATEVDSAGNLVLGGKMIIVGNWGGTKAEGQVVGSKAGHVCLDIDTIKNICNDQYKVSDFYILAPGNSVYSSVPGDGYTTMGGSSMAAPQVTGAMGILHQMWPHMKGENLVKLVLNTADKDINNYNVNIHGQGMLDLDEATKPQGAMGIPTTGRVDGTTTNINSTYFATGTSSAFASLSNVKIMVLDDYDRDYYIKLGDTFTVKDNRKYSDTSMLVNNNHTFLPTQQMYGSFSQGGQWDLVKDYNFGFYTGENGNGDYSTNIGKNFFITDRFKLKTSVGTMSEQETWLGNSSDGVLAVGDNNNTNFGNIGVDYQIGNNVLSFDYTRGRTDINTVDDSLIKSFSDVQTESYRLAYEIHKDKHNTLGWSFSLPSHITSGTMDLEVAESVNLDGTINYETIRSDLTQSTKEKNIGFYLNHTPEHDTDAAYNFTAEYRQDVAGESGKDGINLAMNYTKKFWGSCKFLWMKNPKCYTKDENGKQVLTAEMNKLMFGHNDQDPATKLGLRYDLKTDMFVPINPKDKKWKQ